MKKLAFLISRVFDPVIEIPLMLSAATWWALTNGLRWRFLVFLLIVDALLPALYMFYGLKKGFISDWDITKKEERRGVYMFTAVVHLIGVVYAFFLGKVGLGNILLVFWSLAVVFALVTYFWKISVHAGVNGAALAFFNHFWGWENYWWLILVLLLVLWSRVEIKKHTLMQVLLGSLLAITWVEMGLKFLGS
jgi:membrane-associated phospholipid phosphatase